MPAAAVSRIIGQQVTAATPSTAATPQCSYAYRNGSSSYNLTIAYQRPDGDLGGNQGEPGFDYALRQNRAVAGGSDVTEHEVRAGQRAMRMSGTNLHLGILLTSGRVMTVTGFASSLSGETVDRLVEEVAETFSR